jgi:nucleotide-binding universal stress UspA family protein
LRDAMRPQVAEAFGDPMSKKRRSYESGHKAKYLVVVDDSAEGDRAVYYAARRAARTNGGMIMLRVIDTSDRNQQWLGVADIMRAEAHEAANAGITPERAIREGEPAAEILKLIDEDEDIAVLVLAAGTETEGPGPLVSGIGKTAGQFPIPVTIVPGSLTDEELDALS